MIPTLLTHLLLYTSYTTATDVEISHAPLEGLDNSDRGGFQRANNHGETLAWKNDYFTPPKRVNVKKEEDMRRKLENFVVETIEPNEMTLAQALQGKGSGGLGGRMNNFSDDQNSNGLHLNEIETTFVGGSGQCGNMFDIRALQDITVVDMDIHILNDVETVEVFWMAQTFVGKEQSSSAWEEICIGAFGLYCLVCCFKDLIDFVSNVAFLLYFTFRKCARSRL